MTERIRVDYGSPGARVAHGARQAMADAFYNGVVDAVPEELVTAALAGAGVPALLAEVEEMRDQVQAAEATVERLRGALERIATQVYPEDHLSVVVARAALSGGDESAISDFESRLADSMERHKEVLGRLRVKWEAYRDRLEGDTVEGSLIGASYLIAGAGVTDVLELLDLLEGALEATDD